MAIIILNKNTENEDDDSQNIHRSWNDCEQRSKKMKRISNRDCKYV